MYTHTCIYVRIALEASTCVYISQRNRCQLRNTFTALENTQDNFLQVYMC